MKPETCNQKQRFPSAVHSPLTGRDLKQVLFCFFSSSAGSVVCLIQLRPGRGSCGQLLQLPELWRVCVSQRPLLCLDRATLSGCQDGPTWQVRGHIRRNTKPLNFLFYLSFILFYISSHSKSLYLFTELAALKGCDSFGVLSPIVSPLQYALN